MTAHTPARRAARLAAFCVTFGVALGGCWPEVNGRQQGEVDSTAAGGTANRDNTREGTNSTVAPPGQGSALSDTTAGRLAPAGVSGPTQALTPAAPGPQNANAQTKAQTPRDSAASSTSAPRAGATPAPTKP